MTRNRFKGQIHRCTEVKQIKENVETASKQHLLILTIASCEGDIIACWQGSLLWVVFVVLYAFLFSELFLTTNYPLVSTLALTFSSVDIPTAPMQNDSISEQGEKHHQHPAEM